MSVVHESGGSGTWWDPYTRYNDRLVGAVCQCARCGATRVLGQSDEFYAKSDPQTGPIGGETLYCKACYHSASTFRSTPQTESEISIEQERAAWRRVWGVD